MRKLVFTSLFVLLFTGSFSSLGLAEREHTVRSGQSLSRIARRYHVSVHDLAAANELSVTTELREGQVLRIPEEGVHYVRRGDSLSSIAAHYGVSIRDLARANRLSAEASVRIGQRLVLPNRDTPEERNAAADRWGRPRHPGVVSLLRPAFHEQLRVRTLDDRGRARRAARRRLAHLLRDRRSGAESTPDARLVNILTSISDHFGGRQMVVISGYRPEGGNTQESSRHVQGKAVDLRIRGVDNRHLRDYARTFDAVGVGYYPNSTFVHIDVRDRSAYWVDRAGRGEPADYVRDRAERETIDPTSED